MAAIYHSYMEKSYSPFLFLILLLFSTCSSKQDTTESENQKEEPDKKGASLIYPEENHFRNMKQITFGGDNAEAYWSFNDNLLVFQSNFSDWGVDCDQIFYADPDNDDLSNQKPAMLSSGLGRTTCAYFMPGDSTVLYASTHLGSEDCPEEPERVPGGKYVWPVYDTYDIFVTDLEGNLVTQLTDTPGYDAEATLSPQGDKIVFTSMRSGDLELYVMDIDGSNVIQITDELGYDGGAFFSPDGKMLVFRSSRPQTDDEIAEYKELLSEGLVQPTAMEIYVVNVDGADLRKVTDLGKANWAPFFHPSGDKIIFSSNHAGARGFEFNLYMINLDGTGLERISSDGVFDAFPMFSNDGRRIVFSSNRNNQGTHNTNLFVADWID